MSQHLKPMRIVDRREVDWSPLIDGQRDYHTNTPTPTAIAAKLKEIDEGAISIACEIMEEIEGRDAWVQAVAEQRRQAVTALAWSIEPKDDTQPAKEAAEYVQGVLDDVRHFPETLEWLQTATGCGVAATELIWRGPRLVETNDVPGSRLEQDTTETGRISILTDPEGMFSKLAEFGKYVIHCPNFRAGHPMHVTLLRATVWPWIVKHYALRDWVSFSELFGIPWRGGQYDETATPEDKTVATDMLKNAGPDTWFLLPKGIELKIIEAAKGTHPGEVIVSEMDKRISIAWLGQTLTTDVGSVGSLAAGRVHEGVKASLALSDIAKEKRTIESQVIAPIIRTWQPGKAVPRPLWTRRIFEPKDVAADQLVLSKLAYLDSRKLAVDDDVRYEMLGIPKPVDQEPTPPAP